MIMCDSNRRHQSTGHATFNPNHSDVHVELLHDRARSQQSKLPNGNAKSPRQGTQPNGRARNQTAGQLPHSHIPQGHIGGGARRGPLFPSGCRFSLRGCFGQQFLPASVKSRHCMQQRSFGHTGKRRICEGRNLGGKETFLDDWSARNVGSVLVVWCARSVWYLRERSGHVAWIRDPCIQVGVALGDASSGGLSGTWRAERPSRHRDQARAARH